MTNTARYDSARRTAALTLAATGIVYGDIGTSPLYALRECFAGPHAVPPSEANVLGVLSAIAWSLLIVISLKYLVLVLRADYDGKGGILSLMELVRRRGGAESSGLVLWLGLFGAALLYGDGAITPAISVLSAVDGLEVATPGLGRWVVPITVVILVALFAVQSKGTGGVGRVFGPIVVGWFVVLGALGLTSILGTPEVLRAIDPRLAVTFVAEHGITGITILGIVFLVVTGGEALYADLGHFGRTPIRLSWTTIALPGLLLNYFGQGALLLEQGAAVSNPFYEIVPGALQWPMVVLATVATVIASQAIISGAFSLSFQAIQLGYLPRLEIRHTSAEQRGQIYVPAVNWILLAATLALVVTFTTSSALAGAYGVAIAATMVITTLLLYRALTHVFGWSRAIAVPICAAFLVLDGLFLAANLMKFLDGGWVPLLIAGAVMMVMTTWRRGRVIERREVHDRDVEPVEYLASLGGGGFYRRVPGQVAYLAARPRGTPRALVDNLEHNRALHRQVFVVTVVTLRQAWSAPGERIEVRALRDDIHRVVARLGFMERVDVPELLAEADRTHGLGLDLDTIHYFVGDEFRVPRRGLGLGPLRSHLYVWLARNQHRVTTYYDLPRAQVTEVGRGVDV